MATQPKVIENEELMKMWDWEKNNELGFDPNELTCGSQKKVQWKCKEGHEWKRTIYNQNLHNTCSLCNQQLILKQKNLKDTYPEVAKQWNFEKNNELGLDLNTITYGSHRIVWWKCKEGHEWKARVNSRTIQGNNCPICKNYKIITGKNDLASQCPDLLKKWNYSKNTIKPTEIGKGYCKKVHWICEKGHEFEKEPAALRQAKGMCPICNKERSTSFPEQAIFFYLSKIFECVNRYKIEKTEVDIFIPEKNIAIEYDGMFYHDNSPDAIRKEHNKNNFLFKKNISLFRIKEGTQNKIENNIIYYIYDREYKNLDFAINSLLSLLHVSKKIKIDIQKDRITICEQYILSEKEKSLAVMFPEIAKEWHPTKNGNITPEMVKSASHKKVWWKCQNCENEWEAKVGNRTMIAPNRKHASGCPYCAKTHQQTLQGFNDLQTLYPELIKEWNFEKNNFLPSEVVSGTSKKASWKCSICNHEWISRINTRTLMGYGCPKCAQNNRKTTLKKIDITLFEHLYKQYQKKEITITKFKSQLHVGSETIHNLIQEYEGNKK